MILERNEKRLARNETRLARNETRGGNLPLSSTVNPQNLLLGKIGTVYPRPNAVALPLGFQG